MDIAPLLEPVDASAPCGQNLEYSQEFLALESLVVGTPEQQFGDTVIAAVAPDWAAVAKQSDGLLRQSKDLRLATLRTRAAINQDGVAGLASGLELLAGLLSSYWSDLHPELEDGDATMRINALSALSSVDAVLNDLRQSTYMEVRGLAGCLVKDVEAALAGRSGAESGELSEADINRLVVADSVQAERLAEQLGRARTAAGTITELLDEHTPYHGLDFTALLRLIELLRHPLGKTATAAVPAATPGEALPGAAMPAGGAVAAQSGAAQVAVQWPSAVNSRQEAARLVELACVYFETHEPGHPAPLLLRRGQRLMTMDFLEIIRELAPEGMGQVEAAAGLNR
ncbi:type VI secretion system protein TssA [Chitinimonas arctica]|nr:type VI secretion system protein TssA [Chitinimonas arctica]